MIKLIVVYVPTHIGRNIERAIAYYRSNGFVRTVKRIAVKVRQHPFLRFQAFVYKNNTYSYIRNAIDDRNSEYKGYSEKSPANQIIRYIALFYSSIITFHMDYLI